MVKECLNWADNHTKHNQYIGKNMNFVVQRVWYTSQQHKTGTTCKCITAPAARPSALLLSLNLDRWHSTSAQLFHRPVPKCSSWSLDLSPNFRLHVAANIKLFNNWWDWFVQWSLKHLLNFVKPAFRGQPRRPCFGVALQVQLGPVSCYSLCPIYSLTSLYSHFTLAVPWIVV